MQHEQQEGGSIGTVIKYFSLFNHESKKFLEWKRKYKVTKINQDN